MSNILVYSGPGVSTTALAHTRKALRDLCPSYDVRPTSAEELALQPWQANTCLVVIPGGRDLPYVAEFSKPRAREDGVEVTAQDAVRAWVAEDGGSFVGICAGAYFASSWCSFEEGSKMEVVGPRPGLEFYPGECRGTVYKGFVYESDAGARVVRLDAADGKRTAMHYNGGGAFMDAANQQGVTTLAKYPSDDHYIASPSYAGQAAVVHCQINSGQAILFGTHPEFSLLPGSRPVKLTAAPETLTTDGEANAANGAEHVATAHARELEQADVERRIFLAQCLEKLGLRVQVPLAIPPAASSSDLAAQGKLSLLILVGPPASLRTTLDILAQQAAQLSSSDPLPHIKTRSGQCATTSTGCDDSRLFSMRDANDTLHFYFGRGKTVAGEAAKICDEASYGDFADEETGEVDLHRVPKYVLTFPSEAGGTGEGSLNACPEAAICRHWDCEAYYRHLSETRQRLISSSSDHEPLGDVILYGERVTSTQTLLDKNPRLAAHLPSGFVAFATHQISGRGRGGNSWISPLGCLQFSLLLHVLPTSPLGATPMIVGPKLVFAQYLAGLAIVEAVRQGLGEEYAAVGRKIRLKWPNDIYAETSSDERSAFKHMGKSWAKMGGILVNSHYSSGNWQIVVGCGVNCLNPLPTTSLSALIDDHNAATGASLPHVTQEKLAGAVLASFERVWADFLACGGQWATPSGFGGPSLAQRYRDVWLHSDQPTLLTTVSPPQEVRIVGIAADTGMLRVVPASGPGARAGFSAGSTLSCDDDAAWSPSLRGRDDVWHLQPDGNSFDMLKNLIKVKA
ncbi:hypothetical protein BDZ90DRAFT_173286 [Jaminaea rosea]|uniref:BPL/LPL catalytic domain-containing protein n=1 Tax=Jaminaea rosea TaxID=1569628 RepID=A0A316URA1_9BASI|nr:hypothetical protein BDZ90DRAFT_173286 [Jaminaea rosea]PWN27839.1 hypothetical protein BDZ90DRAFT_173286 [Jaminaea rosea]